MSTEFGPNRLNHGAHIVQEGPTGLNVVTMKTGYTMISFRVRTTKNYTFENTFHQPFLRYGNPDLLFWEP